MDSNQRPPASEAGTLAGLSYTLLALRREIESLSPDRQSGRLTRCVTERDRIRFPSAFTGERNLVRLGRLERPLHALSTHSLCQLGYRRVVHRRLGRVLARPNIEPHAPKRWVSRRARPNLQAAAKLEDQAGFEPAVSLRCRLKRPARSTATETGPRSWALLR